ncbi:PQQ-like beta-propeller repeat protein [candidate division FCPU426 bacterium]|nr:PQQ-like beta-propeller repeat protein [candidate division FCPU426 bacterium]
MLNGVKGVSSGEPTQQKHLRLWPGVVIVILQWLIRFGLPVVMPDANGAAAAMMTGLLGGIAIMAWWAFFSRAPRFERWGAVALMIVTLAATFFINDTSIRTGMMGLMFFMYAVPLVSLAFVVWAVAARSLPDTPRRVIMVAVILLACGGWTLVRSEGITSDAGADLTWRWAPTAEEQLLATSSDEPETLEPATDANGAGVNWPGFRGPNRDSILHGTNIATDWSASPPEKLWSRKIGPGCSSFAVKGSLLYTQEQRGKYEVVSCYNLNTGKPVWKHRDQERFWDSHAGAGPRSTPTLYNGRVFTFGPTGVLNVLDEQDGSVVWSRQVGVENKVDIPAWALTSSPLAVDDKVIIAVEGMLLAYDCATGEPRWRGPNGGKSYSSPQLLTIDGVEQVLLMSSAGAVGVNAADGSVLWEYKWPKGERIVQPALMENGSLLVSSGEGMAIRRVAISLGPDGWITEEKWTSTDIKPYFNDIVIHKGHVYGFDAPALVSINAEDGTLKWRGGRYGGGQLMLLADQDLFIVISEQGELALVKAEPEKFTELARIQGIKGRVWNHPALVNDILLVRNSKEMVAYRLAVGAETKN